MTRHANNLDIALVSVALSLAAIVAAYAFI